MAKELSKNKYLELLGLMTLARKYYIQLQQVNKSMASHLVENVEGLELDDAEEWVSDVVFGCTEDTDALVNVEELLTKLGIAIEQ
jgi:hypothetical protein